MMHPWARTDQFANCAAALPPGNGGDAMGGAGGTNGRYRFTAMPWSVDAWRIGRIGGGRRQATHLQPSPSSSFEKFVETGCFVSSRGP